MEKVIEGEEEEEVQEEHVVLWECVVLQCKEYTSKYRKMATETLQQKRQLRHEP